ncbi:MAG: PAS domain-containing protein, partial [Sphingomonadales bacterium]
MALTRSGLRAGPQAQEGPGFAELFGALPIAVLVIDPDGRIAHANPACESMLNHSESAMIGQPYDAVLLPPEDYADRRDGHGFAAFDIEI